MGVEGEDIGDDLWRSGWKHVHFSKLESSDTSGDLEESVVFCCCCFLVVGLFGCLLFVVVLFCCLFVCLFVFVCFFLGRDIGCHRIGAGLGKGACFAIGARDSLWRHRG